ncbi:AAA family ATPase [Sphingomonas sp. MMS12-HWE2-04]|uniref:AAA family ATPase n=1 Tax=Sphingomonas sp. MMS12-HWE2-04 TaxID=3234199 RepID=UPI00384D60D2
MARYPATEGDFPMGLTQKVQHWLRTLFAADSGRRIPLLLEAPAWSEAPSPAPALARAIAPAPRPVIAFRRNAVFAAFNTAMPVTDRHGLAGRQRELVRLMDSVVIQRKHALIFGGRGSGKTSLARVFGDLADEAGCVALYGSASAGADVGGLFRPFLAELPMTQGSHATIGADADVQQLANLFVANVTQRTLLIVDEFDRVESPRTRHDVATLLKLLTDMHAPVQVVLVGIAGNVDGLIASHPSLRRHLFAQPVPPIANDELAGLLRLCGQQAGLELDERAVERIVGIALGSPYHARLVGMHAALAADTARRDRVTLADVQQGTADAIEEWSDLSPEVRRIFDRALRTAGPLRSVLAAAGALASQSQALDADRLARASADLFEDARDSLAAAEQAIALLRPALTEREPGLFEFEDSLSPQFLVLLATETAPADDIARTPQAEAPRERIQGVAAL